MKLLLYILFFPFIVVWYAFKLCINAYLYFFGRRTAGNDGYDFEYTCAEVLIRRGFHSVKVTKSSGDQGADIIACKGMKKYAVQCKLYSRPVGNKAVQEAYAGMGYYKCSHAAVMTNSTFTKGAVDLAESLNVELWDNTPTFTARRRSPFIFWGSLFVALSAIAIMAEKGINAEKQAGVLLGWLGFIVLYIIFDPLIKFIIGCIANAVSNASDSNDYDEDYDEEYDDDDGGGVTIK